MLRPYSDSTYRAQVNGLWIGEYRLTLDWIETYDHTIIRNQEITHCSRFAVTAGVSDAYTPKDSSPMSGPG